MTARPPMVTSTNTESQLASRGDVLVIRLSRRLGTLWKPKLPAPDEQPLRAAQKLATYAVREGKLQAPAQHTVSRTHQRSWNSVTQLLPTELAADIATFTLATDGRGHDRGWLLPQAESVGWQLALDPRDSAPLTRLNTLIYQSAFLLALAPRQIQPLPVGELCPTVLTAAGCVQPGNLLHRYVRTFWSDELLKTWRQRQVSDQPEKAQALFEAYPGTFLNVSAARGPEQDFATAWTAFVLSPRPKQAKTTAQRKVAFFYSDPELTALRLTLLRRISSAFPAKS